MKFNVMVTTYEFIMRDRAKLSKVEWKYMIIDEAQRMKDRESRLARDLDRFSCQRRLLLTGTPLQVLFCVLGIYTPFLFTHCLGLFNLASLAFQEKMFGFTIPELLQPVLLLLVFGAGADYLLYFQFLILLVFSV
jgi:SWI/SNF-related matrix-associated actin-dependent regulator of chromatin subfamily A protein 2/4